MKDEGIKRRDFLKGAVAGGAVGLLCGCAAVSKTIATALLQKPPCNAKFPPARLSVPGWPIVPLTLKLPPELVPPPPEITAGETLKVCAFTTGQMARSAAMKVTRSALRKILFMFRGTPQRAGVADLSARLSTR